MQLRKRAQSDDSEVITFWFSGHNSAAPMHAGAVETYRSSFVAARIIDVTEGSSCPDFIVKIQLIDGRMQKRTVEDSTGKIIVEVDGAGLAADEKGYYVYDFSRFEIGNPDAVELIIKVRQRAGASCLHFGTQANLASWPTWQM